MRKVIFSITLCMLVGGIFVAGMLSQAFLDRQYIQGVFDLQREIHIHEVNILLKEDRYKIYFKIHPNGDLALIHPTWPKKPKEEEPDEDESIDDL